MHWCSKQYVDPIAPNEVNIVNYLTTLCLENRSYSCINTHKCAISQTLASLGNSKFVDNAFIARFMKGIFNFRPPIPKYRSFWDVQKVLNFLATQFPLNELNLEMLTYKTTALLALTSAQRSQTLSLMNVDHMNITENFISFSIQDLQKTSKFGNWNSLIKIDAFHDKTICPVFTLKHYLEKTKEKRKSSKLLVSFKTFQQVTSSSIARWLKRVLELSGIDISVFQAHSFRGASCSTAYLSGVTMKDILSTANWSSASTFHRFYNRNIQDQNQFSSAVLSRKDMPSIEGL